MKEFKVTILTHKDDFKVNNNKNYCGLRLLSVIMSTVKLVTKVSYSNLKTKLKKSDLPGFQFNVTKLYQFFVETRTEIRSNGDYTYNEYTRLFFDALQTATNDDFLLLINTMKNSWEAGQVFSIKDVGDAALTNYNNLCSAGCWDGGSAK